MAVLIADCRSTAPMVRPPISQLIVVPVMLEA